MIPNRIEPTQDELVMQFIANCVQWAADKIGCDYLTMFHRMDKVGMLDKYLMEYYDVLHCESRQNITDDVLETLEAWENHSNKGSSGNN